MDKRLLNKKKSANNIFCGENNPASEPKTIFISVGKSLNPMVYLQWSHIKPLHFVAYIPYILRYFSG